MLKVMVKKGLMKVKLDKVTVVEGVFNGIQFEKLIINKINEELLYNNDDYWIELADQTDYLGVNKDSISNLKIIKRDVENQTKEIILSDILEECSLNELQKDKITYRRLLDSKISKVASYDDSEKIYLKSKLLSQEKDLINFNEFYLAQLCGSMGLEDITNYNISIGFHYIIEKDEKKYLKYYSVIGWKLTQEINDYINTLKQQYSEQDNQVEFILKLIIILAYMYAKKNIACDLVCIINNDISIDISSLSKEFDDIVENLFLSDEEKNKWFNVRDDLLMLKEVNEIDYAFFFKYLMLTNLWKQNKGLGHYSYLLNRGGQIYTSDFKIDFSGIKKEFISENDIWDYSVITTLEDFFLTNSRIKTDHRKVFLVAEPIIFEGNILGDCFISGSYRDKNTLSKDVAQTMREDIIPIFSFIVKEIQYAARHVLTINEIYKTVIELQKQEFHAEDGDKHENRFWELVLETYEPIRKAANAPILEHARKAANISILVDSFSHNVAAHSLAALSQYYASRKSMLDKEIITKELFQKNHEIPILAKEQIERIKSLFGKEREVLSISEVFRSNNEDVISNLLTFIQNGDDTVKLPVPIDDSLYYFINYLSEKAEFWSTVIEGESFSNSIENIHELISGFINNPIFLGTLPASEGLNKIMFIINNYEYTLVDLSAINNENPYQADYEFVKKQVYYTKVKDEISQMRVWLPGGSVGRQSVYTIFENCLRNIKHYDYKKIKIEGIINFHLDIEGPVDDKFELKFYLSHSDYYDGENATKIVSKIRDKINKGTFDNVNNQPVMGGTSQSILCAQQLLSGKFISDHTENSKKDIDKPFQVYQENGYVIYSIKLWQGEKYKIISDDKENHSIENLNRFGFLIAKPASSILTDLKRTASDMVRVMESDHEDYQEIYKIWLKKWLGDEKFNKGIQLLFDGEHYDVPEGSTNKIDFSHGEANSAKLHFRNHGVFVKHIKSNWETRKYEVMESILTGVYAVDDRLYNVWKSKLNSSEFRTELFLKIKSESDASALKDDWVNIRNSELEIKIRESVNFLIVHLSFIEKLCQEFKDDINIFVRKVKQVIGNRENFHLVITTGRGRSEWKESTAEEFKSFVKYRSVFSMQKALLNASMIDDDFDAKYNLTKVLFGS